MEILISMKGLDDGEKQAQALDGAFNVHLWMPLADRTDINKLKEYLLKEFEPGQTDREKAIWGTTELSAFAQQTRKDIRI